MSIAGVSASTSTGLAQQIAQQAQAAAASQTAAVVQAATATWAGTIGQAAAATQQAKHHPAGRTNSITSIAMAAEAVRRPATGGRRDRHRVQGADRRQHVRLDPARTCRGANWAIRCGPVRRGVTRRGGPPDGEWVKLDGKLHSGFVASDSSAPGTFEAILAALDASSRDLIGPAQPRLLVIPISR